MVALGALCFALGGGFGRAYGACTAFIPLSMLAPFAVARAQEATGSYAVGFVALAGLVLLGGASALLVMRVRRARLSLAEPAST